MNDSPGKSFPTVILCLVLASVVGCAGKTYRIGKMTIWPIGGPITDEVPGVTPPQERIRQLREVAKAALSATPEEQEKTSAELAGQYASEEDPLIRIELVRAVAPYRTTSADMMLHKAVADSDSDVRRAACDAWGQRGGKDATTVLSETLGRDSDLDVRLAAARALGETRDSAAVAALGLALDDPDPAMQFRAVSSLQQVTGNDLGNDVGAWRQYVKGEVPQSQPPTIVQRWFHWF